MAHFPLLNNNEAVFITRQNKLYSSEVVCTMIISGSAQLYSILDWDLGGRAQPLCGTSNKQPYRTPLYPLDRALISVLDHTGHHSFLIGGEETGETCWRGLNLPLNRKAFRV